MAGTVNNTQGIKAIKINRTDLQSIDNTLSLQELKILRIRFSDKGIQEFNITGIAEYLDYYLFYVVPNNLFTSSQGIAYLYGPQGCQGGLPTDGIYTVTPGTETERVLNFSIPSATSSSIDNSTGLWNPWISEDIKIEIRYRVSQSSAGASYFTAYLTGSDTEIIPSYLNSNDFENSPGFWNSVTQSFTWNPPTPNSSIGFGFANDLFSNNALAFDFSTLNFKASQSNFILADNNVKNENLNASANLLRTIAATDYDTIQFWTASLHTLISDTWYTLDRPNNVLAQSFTCSFQARTPAGSAGNGQLLLQAYAGTTYVASDSWTVPIGTAFTTYAISGSYTMNSAESMSMIIGNGLSYDIQVRSGSWEVNQVAGTNIASNQVVLEPYLTANFQYSDCNVLAGNAVEARVNDFYMDVDYTSNAIIAVNEQSILSGSATRATVQQSNYTTAGVVNSRYIGKELQSAVFNEWTDGDVSFGKTPNVSNPENYFVYFNWVGGTSPEWGNNLEDRTAANVRFIVDANGNTIKPTNDDGGINLGIIRQSFEEDKTAIVALNSDDEFGINLGAINGEWPIFKSGYRIEPIVYTQTASYDNNGDVVSFGYTGSLDFVSGDLTPNPSIADFQLLTLKSPNQSFNRFDSYPLVLTYQSPTILGDSGSFSSNIYSPITTNPSPTVTLTVLAGITALILSPATVTYAIQRNQGAGWSTVKTFQINHNSSLQGGSSYTDSAATTSTQYRIVVSTFQQQSTQTGEPAEVILSSQSYFRVNQAPFPNNGKCTSFWATGSGGTQLTASSGLNGLNSFYGQTQKNIVRSGFNPITLPFIIEEKDEVRFEGTETLSYEVRSVTQSSAGNIVLNLDGTIPSGTNTDYFLVRRYVDDPSYVILEVNKPAGASSAGVLKPKYITSTLSSSLEEIVKELQS